MKHALVTGGCGFLGSAIARELRERGVAVRVLALAGEGTDNVADLDVEVVRGDVLDIADCQAAVAGVDTVFHAAAIYKGYMPDPSLMYEVNSRGTFHMLEAARREGVATTVYTASIASLGRPAPGRLADEQTPYDGWEVDFAYSRAKYHSRVIAESFGEWGQDVRVVCPGMVFGPGDLAPTPSGKLILELLAGGPPIYTDGGASYVDVRDAAKVHVLAAAKGRPGERYVATGHNLSQLEFVELVARVAGKPRRYFKLPAALAVPLLGTMNMAAMRRTGEPMVPMEMFRYSLVAAYFDNAKSRRELGATYRPLEETIGDAIAYFKRTGKAG
jgi:dihydroflavonol-4-reductase